MFGYIVANQPELKIKDYDEYKRYYCGLCHSLKKIYGTKGQISLSYDMTFLVILLSALYEPERQVNEGHCIPHPVKKHQYIQNEYTDYVADMNVILTYYKCVDDWQDEGRLSKLLYSKWLIAGNGKKREQYAAKIKVIVENLRKIKELEEAGSDDLDALSGYFGNIMAEICVAKNDEWEESLRVIGYNLGRFVYIMDAYDDIEKDMGSGNFNPFVVKYDSRCKECWREIEEYAQDALMIMASSLAKEFELLPILRDVDILRNIIYSGIWEAFYATGRRRGLGELSHEE
jgi:hypothetical protein